MHQSDSDGANAMQLTTEGHIMTKPNQPATDTLLTDIAQHAIVLPPGVGSPAPDPGDQLLWNLLAARPDLLLVTGDKALQRDAGSDKRVVSPQAFVDAP